MPKAQADRVLTATINKDEIDGSVGDAVLESVWSRIAVDGPARSAGASRSEARPPGPVPMFAHG